MSKMKSYKRRKPIKGPAPRRVEAPSGLTRNQIFAIVIGVLICLSMVLALVIVPGAGLGG